MGCCPSKRRAAQQAVEDEIQEQERGRPDTTIGEEYINPLRSKQSTARLGSTVTNPTFRLVGDGGGGGGNDGISTEDSRVVRTGSAAGEGGGEEEEGGKGIGSGGGSAKTGMVAKAHAAAAFDANDNGREEVDSMIGKIKAQMSEFDAANAAIEVNGGMPPPGSDLATVASEESCDAIGALFTIEKSLQLQLEELVARGGSEGAKSHAADLAAVRKDLADTSGTLRAAVASYLDSWKGAVPDLSSLPTDPEAFAKLPIANKPGKVTMQQVIGALVLDAEAKRDPAGPDGGARQGLWDHGEIRQKKAEARLGKAGFEDGYFLARSFSSERSGEYYLVIAYKGKQKGHLIKPDPTTGMLTVNNKSYGDAKTMPNLIALLQTKPEGWHINLDKLVPYPESAIGFGIASELLTLLLEAYGKQRTKESVPLVRAVRVDMDAYSAAAAKHVALAGPDVMQRLDAAAEPTASKSMSFSAKKLAKMTHDPKAPAPTSLSYVAYAQRVAADISIAVYGVICLMITAVGVGGYCIPGNVKQSRRIIFKTLFKYGGLFLKCRDLSRVTIKVPNLTVMAQLAEALHKHPQLKVWRCKNRFSAKERGNAQDSGGYLDFQMVCLFELNGRYHYVEVQLNLIEMVAIKAGSSGDGGGGHDAFNTARVIDAFSRRSTEYRGNPTAELWAMIAAGSVQRVILDGATITGDDAEQLEKSMESSQCRVEHVSVKGFKLDAALLTGSLLSLWLNSVEESGIADLSGWKNLTVLPEGLSKLVKLQSLNLRLCENLTMVPDLSHLLRKLKIKNVPKHLSEWEKQGFVAFDFTDAANVAKTTTLDLSHFAESELPEWVSKLVNLQSLNLSECKQLTMLPEGISELVNLQSLDLERCENLTTLPEGISKLVNLQSLNLSDCKKLTTLPEGMSKLVNLQSLNLSDCKKLMMLPEWLSKLVNLQSVNLDHCEKLASVPDLAARLVTKLDWSSSPCSELPEWLSKLVNLQSLNLEWCKKLTMLPEWVSKLVNLQSLNLRWCSRLTMLPEGMSKLVNLQSLDLESCENLTTLPEGISKLVNLQSLDLERCENLTTLPEGISKLVNLQSLNLNHCKKLTTLPEGMSKLVNLQSLDLSWCTSLAEPLPDLSHLFPVLKVETDSASTAAKAWAKLGMFSMKEGPSSPAAITTLDLAHFGGHVLPEWVSKLVNLQSLNLEWCKKLTMLPEGMSKLVNLQSLNLEWCENLTTLPEWVSKFVNLQSLNLRLCSRLTMLPEGMSKLVNLQSLDLECCENLTTLPEGMSKLVNLQSLNLRWCSRLTMLPEGISKLVNLQSLNLSDCKKLMMLPEWLSKLVNLQSLDLSWCTSLAEPLPDLSHLFPVLKVETDSASTAAKAWAKLGMFSMKEGPSSPAAITTLDLAHFGGHVLPEWVSKLVNLQSLDLSGCWNLKMLPEWMSKLVNLQSLNLNHCSNLTMLPEWMSKLVNLQSLDLSWCTRLTMLPEGISKLVNLQSLNLNQSNLTMLPEWMSKLVNLQSLDLSWCTSLAEPLPDLSHLFPVLKVETDSASTAAKAWAKLGMFSMKEGPSSPAAITTLDLAHFGGHVLPEWVSKLVNLESLKLSYCYGLAEPLPDLSHLLPALKVGVGYSASDAVKAWEKRGFTAAP